MRKLRGLAESSDGRVSGVGQEMEGLMQTLMDAIYAARIDLPPEGLPSLYAAHVDRMKRLCNAHWSDAHSALRSVAREFLYDWEVIMRPLAEPSPAALQQRRRTGPAPLGHCAQHQPRHALRSGHPSLRSPGQRHRNLPSSRRLLMALSRLCHPGGSQGHGTSPASRYPGNSVKTEGV
jgi:hypothetical protein